MEQSINDAGLDLLKSFEKCRLKAYKDSGGILTIGWGHTGEDVHEGQVISQEDADDLLGDDLSSFEAGVADLLDVDATPNQFSALVVFSYNVGLNALSGSTLLKKFNSGDTTGASEQFLRWNKVNGQPLEGLTRRREAEKSLFLTP